VENSLNHQNNGLYLIFVEYKKSEDTLKNKKTISMYDLDHYFGRHKKPNPYFASIQEA